MLLQPITVQFSKSTLKPSVYTLTPYEPDWTHWLYMSRAGPLTPYEPDEPVDGQ